MNYSKYSTSLGSLKGKSVAVTGATGGIGKELCKYIAALGGNITIIARNDEKAEALKKEITRDYPAVTFKVLNADLEDFESVKLMCKRLKKLMVDILILNAGAYSIPRKTTSLCVNNVFQINCVSQFYIAQYMIPYIKHIVVTSSIAYSYTKCNSQNLDGSLFKSEQKIYGNSKRCLTFSMYELIKRHTDTSICVCHPGITFTNITAHYPKWLLRLIKYPMKIIFIPPKKAALSILYGCFSSTEDGYWIGPRIFNIWGLPKPKRMKQYNKKEAEISYSQIYDLCKKELP